MRWLRKILVFILSLPVHFYRYCISPLTPSSCRHVPTCSMYMLQALKVHGPLKGFWLGLVRLSKCHPWGTHGHDPVPPKS
ncbi:membrane protein insertion efficiency factor YidD [Prolixibacteraceae bacterium JC049]|nr:membrane protein insertion efficiency factor YidD [Prolixibacteraceae bacterium JC049]